jgi:hypothetical protein
MIDTTFPFLKCREDYSTQEGESDQRELEDKRKTEAVPVFQPQREKLPKIAGLQSS